MKKEDFEEIAQYVRRYMRTMLDGFGLSESEKRMSYFEQNFMPAHKYSGDQSIDHKLFRKFLRYHDALKFNVRVCTDQEIEDMFIEE